MVDAHHRWPEDFDQSHHMHAGDLVWRAIVGERNRNRRPTKHDVNLVLPLCLQQGVVAEADFFVEPGVSSHRFEVEKINKKLSLKVWVVSSRIFGV